MSWETIGWAKEQTQLTQGPRYLLLLLALRCDDEHTCYPGQERLAEESGQGLRTIRRYLAQLEDGGYIGRIARYGPGGKRTSDRTILEVGKGRIGADQYDAAIIVGPGGNTIRERTPLAEAAEDYRPDWPVDTLGVSGHSDTIPGLDDDRDTPGLPANDDRDTPGLPATAWPGNIQVTTNNQITTSASTDVDAEEKPRRQRKADLVWDAVMAACGVAEPIPDSARGAYGRAVKDLRSMAAKVGVDDATLASLVEPRAQLYRQRWPNTTCTPPALVRHWAELRPSTTTATRSWSQ